MGFNICMYSIRKMSLQILPRITNVSRNHDDFHVSKLNKQLGHVICIRNYNLLFKYAGCCVRTVFALVISILEYTIKKLYSKRILGNARLIGYFRCLVGKKRESALIFRHI